MYTLIQREQTYSNKQFCKSYQCCTLAVSQLVITLCLRCSLLYKRAYVFDWLYFQLPASSCFNRVFTDTGRDIYSSLLEKQHIFCMRCISPRAPGFDLWINRSFKVQHRIKHVWRWVLSVYNWTQIDDWEYTCIWLKYMCVTPTLVTSSWGIQTSRQINAVEIKHCVELKTLCGADRCFLFWFSSNINIVFYQMIMNWQQCRNIICLISDDWIQPSLSLILWVVELCNWTKHYNKGILTATEGFDCKCANTLHIC